MLTGDKVDTAINIGHSCSLLNTEMAILRLCADDDEEEEKEGRPKIDNAVSSRKYFNSGWNLENSHQLLGLHNSSLTFHRKACPICRRRRICGEDENRF